MKKNEKPTAEEMPKIEKSPNVTITPVLEEGPVITPQIIEEATCEENPNPDFAEKIEGMTAKTIAGMFVMFNDMYISRRFPSQPLTDIERKQLQTSSEQLIAYYNRGTIPPWLAIWMNFAGAVGIVYMIRFIEETGHDSNSFGQTGSWENNPSCMVNPGVSATNEKPGFNP